MGGRESRAPVNPGSLRRRGCRTNPAHLQSTHLKRLAPEGGTAGRHRVKCSPVCSRNKVREKRPFEANLTLEVSIKMRRLDPNHKTLVCKEITIFKINCKTILLVAEVVQKAKKKKRVSCSL